GGGRHALPVLVGTGDIVGGAALVGEGVRSVVAVNLMLEAGCFQRLLEIVDGGGCAPIILVGEVALKRHPYLGRVGKVLRRYSIEADCGVDFMKMHRGGDC